MKLRPISLDIAVLKLLSLQITLIGFIGMSGFTNPSQATILGDIFVQSEHDLPNRFFQSVHLPGLRRCLAKSSDNRLRIIFGNPYYGYQEFPLRDFHAINTETIEILPSGYRHSLEFYCSTDQKWHLLAKKRLTPPSTLMNHAETLTHAGNGFTPPFVAMVSSLAIPDIDFATTDKPSNIGVIHIINRFGEVIWTYIPRILGKTIAHPMAIQTFNSKGLLITFAGQYAAFDLKGTLLASGYLCERKNQCDGDRTIVLADSVGTNLFYAKTSKAFLRVDWEHLFVKPAMFYYPQITQVNTITGAKTPLNRATLDIAINEDKIIALDLSENSQRIATERTLFDIKNGTKSDRLQIFAMSSFGADRIVLLTRRAEDRQKIQLEVLPRSDPLLKPIQVSSLPNKYSWFAASMSAISSENIMIFALRSDPSNLRRKDIVSDVVFEWNIENESIISSLFIENQFYSQMRNHLPLAGLPQYKYLGGTLDTL